MSSKYALTHLNICVFGIRLRRVFEQLLQQQPVARQALHLHAVVANKSVNNVVVAPTSRADIVLLTIANTRMNDCKHV